MKMSSYISIIIISKASDKIMSSFMSPIGPQKQKTVLSNYI